MARIVDLSGPSFDFVLYGDKGNHVQNYLQQQIASFGPVLNEFGNRMYTALNNTYNFVTDVATNMFAMSELTNQGLVENTNEICYYDSWEGLRYANPTMQRWIMANPSIRTPYLNNNAEGYGDEYNNYFGDDIGEEHYDYRRVMNGILVHGKDDVSRATSYVEDLLPWDRELTFWEQERVLSTWSTIDWIMENHEFDFSNSSSDEMVKFNK